MSNRKPDRGVVTKAAIDGKLPRSASSVSVMTLFRVVFVAEENSLRVDDGHAYIMPKLKHK